MTKLMGKINHALLDEWGLNQVTYQILNLSCEPIDWHDAETLVRLKEISGQPAAALRKLVDRGLLDGPSRKQLITERPFEATKKGLELLDKIKRGLHHWNWLSAGKIRVLTILAPGAQPDEELKKRKCHRMSILSLRDATYIARSDSDVWEITALGLEALQEQNR